jgi:hypothetical protein
MDIRLSGGECSGTLNGRDIQSAPASARASVSGLESCGPAVEEGHFAFKIAGHTISGAMTYRRVGPRNSILLQGDDGGQAVLLARGEIGVVGQDDPLAATPVVGPQISGPVTDEEAFNECSGEGISQLPVAVDVLNTVQPLSG